MTIVVNTLTGSVTRYSWPVTCVTAKHASDASKIYTHGGATDDGQPISASFTTGLKSWGASVRKFVAYLYFAMSGQGSGSAQVITRQTIYPYTFPVRAGGVSRAPTGRGIREDYLAFGFTNVDGADFRIDSVEPVSAQSTTRRL